MWSSYSILLEKSELYYYIWQVWEHLDIVSLDSIEKLVQDLYEVSWLQMVSHLFQVSKYLVNIGIEIFEFSPVWFVYNILNSIHEEVQEPVSSSDIVEKRVTQVLGLLSLSKNCYDSP
jgi:hypothetical protein